jgi:hypothetical protein
MGHANMRVEQAYLAEQGQNVAFFRFWPEADDVGVAASRQLSGVHQPCGQRSHNGRI